MSKQEIEVTGVVEEVLPNSQYRIRLEMSGGEHLILGYTSGKMKAKRIQVTTGDRVTVVLSPYDLTKGRIIWRLSNFDRQQSDQNAK